MEQLPFAMILTAIGGLVYGFACGSNSGDALDGGGCGLGAGLMVSLMAFVLTVGPPYCLCIVCTCTLGGLAAGVTPDTSKIKRRFNPDLSTPGYRSRRWRS